MNMYIFFEEKEKIYDILEDNIFSRLKLWIL